MCSSGVMFSNPNQLLELLCVCVCVDLFVQTVTHVHEQSLSALPANKTAHTGYRIGYGSDHKETCLQNNKPTGN